MCGGNPFSKTINILINHPHNHPNWNYLGNFQKYIWYFGADCGWWVLFWNFLNFRKKNWYVPIQKSQYKLPYTTHDSIYPTDTTPPPRRQHRQNNHHAKQPSTGTGRFCAFTGLGGGFRPPPSCISLVVTLETCGWFRWKGEVEFYLSPKFWPPTSSLWRHFRSK